MKAQSQLRSDSHKRTSRSRRAAPRAAETPIRDEVVKRAKRRLAAGFYDSDVCLDITVRRISRDLKRPAVVVIAKSPARLPGRTAQKGPGKSRRRG